MAGNKSQLGRLLFIDREIRAGMGSGRLANCSSLARQYEVSAKTILRDIDFMKSRMDAPIAYDSRRRGYLYSEENYALPALRVREGELFALLVAQKGLEQYRGTPVYESLASVFKRIEQSLPEQVSLDAAWLGARISILPEQHTRIDHQVWETTLKALRQGRTVRISHCRPGAEACSEREVDPYHIVGHQGEWYLIGFCRSRGEVRTFAISRIASALPTGRAFRMPDSFAFDEFRRSSFGIIRGDRPCTVTLRFAAGLAPYVREREWHPAQKVREHRDGGLTLSLPATDLIEVKCWALSWGPGVRVMAPRRLATQVADDLAAALRVYGVAGTSGENPAKTPFIDGSPAISAPPR